MYVKIVNGEVDKFPYSMSDLRKDYRNVSFSARDDLAPYGVYLVTYAVDPDYDYRTERLVPQQPTMVDGVWTVTKAVVSKTQVEIDVDNSQKAAEIRNQRDMLLTETDWRFRSDMNPSQEWINYCQALRDIPQQEGFPWEVIFPTKPE